MTSPDPNRPDRSAPVANGRLGTIVRGYLGACFVGAWGMAGGLIVEDLATGHRVSGRLSDFGVVVGGLFVVMLVAAAPLATAAIMATESYRMRAAWPFPLVGAAIGIVIEAVASLLLRPPGTVIATSSLFLLAGIVGAIGGLTYWALAIRGHRSSRPRDTIE